MKTNEKPPSPNRIRQIREKKGLSLKDVAHGAGLAWRYLQRIEKGKISPSLNTAQRIRIALGCRKDEFLL